MALCEAGGWQSLTCECDVMPKGSKRNDADKTMSLALGCRPRMIEGEMYDGNKNDGIGV